MYKIKVTDKEGYFLGYLLDCTDEIINFDTEKEAITTKHIEETQIETELYNYEVVEE